MTETDDCSMTAPSTDDLTRLLAECTPGPWTYEYTRLGHTVRQPGSHLALMVVNHAENPESDAALIAAAPAIAADLIALRKAAEGMAEAIRKASEWIDDLDPGDQAVLDNALAAYEATK